MKSIGIILDWSGDTLYAYTEHQLEQPVNAYLRLNGAVYHRTGDL